MTVLNLQLALIGLAFFFLALTIGLASLLSATLFYATWCPYRRHYAQMHAAQ